MEITENERGSALQINLEGRFDANTCETVEKYIREKMEAGTIQFILNMEKVSFIASAGLRVILVFAKKLQEKEGDLHLANLQPNVIRVFEISGLKNAIRIFKDLDSAFQGFTTE